MFFRKRLRCFTRIMQSVFRKDAVLFPSFFVISHKKPVLLLCIFTKVLLTTCIFTAYAVFLY